MAAASHRLIALLVSILLGPSFVNGLKCYACFYDEQTGLGGTCEAPNNREYFVKCRSREDVDQALEYIGIQYRALRKAAGLERRIGDVVEEEAPPQFVCILVRGDFRALGLGVGRLRSCWQLPKRESVTCGNITLSDEGDSRYDGCFCAKDHKSGIPCNGEHEKTLADQLKLDSSIQQRHKGIDEDDKHDDDDMDKDMHSGTSHVKVNSVWDHLINVGLIIELIAIVEVYCLLFNFDNLRIIRRP